MWITSNHRRSPPLLSITIIFLILLLSYTNSHSSITYFLQSFAHTTMASEKARRENTTNEVEKDIVPKMTTHFESLADKVEGLKFGGGGEGEQKNEKERKRSETTHKEEIPRGVGKFEMHDEEEEKGSGTDMKAQERVADKEKSGSFDKEGGGEQRERPSLAEISKYRATAQQNSMEAIRAAEERYQKATELGSSELHNIKEKGAQAKDTAKDALASTAKTPAEYTTQTPKKAKEVAVEKATVAKEAAVEKAAVAKGVAVEKGKSATGYAGEVAETLKDKVVVGGWGATHYVCEKTEEATKAAANVAQQVAGYAGEKAAAAKDTIVATEESAKEYAARKKVEAEKELEAKKKSKVEGGGQEPSEEQQGIGLGGKREDEKEVKSGESIQEFSEGGSEKERTGGGGGGGVLQAIGETIVEIAQTTKELVAGREPNGGGKGSHESGQWDDSK